MASAGASAPRIGSDLRNQLRWVLQHPESRKAKDFLERLRLQRIKAQAAKAVASGKPNPLEMPKVVLAVPSCESMGLQAVSPLEYSMGVLEGKLQPPRSKIIQVKEGERGEPPETRLCVPQAVASSVPDPDETLTSKQLVSFMVETMAKNDGEFQLDAHAKEVMRDPEAADSEAKTIKKLALLVAQLRNKLRNKCQLTTN